MQFNVVPRTGGLAINRKHRGKRGVQQHNSHSSHPPTVVHIETVLFASFSVSFLSAILAMFGKQWLNDYVSTDMRGSAVKPCQDQ